MLDLTYALGAELAETEGLNVTMVVDVFRGLATTYNVIAETRAGDPVDRGATGSRPRRS
ncbi:MAG: hypothetical protein ACR2JP_01665 [Acidimicrobiia bacterium]